MNVRPNFHVTWSFLLIVLVASGAFAAWAQKNPNIITDTRRDVRDDGMAEKLRLIEQAYDEGDYDLALSLAKSIEGTLADVRDEQLYKIDANAVDLGYIRDVKIRNGVAEILMTMPHRGRTVYQYLVYSGGGRNTMGIRERLLELNGIQDVVVHVTWDPPWTLSRLTDAGRRTMGLEE